VVADRFDPGELVSRPWEMVESVEHRVDGFDRPVGLFGGDPALTVAHVDRFDRWCG
jgi:hypothetical protein